MLDKLTRRKELVVKPNLELYHSPSMSVTCKTQSKVNLEPRNNALGINNESN